MSGVLLELLDGDKVFDFVKGSLGCVEKLRSFGSILKEDERIIGLLEEELRRTLPSSSDDEYVGWLCETLEKVDPHDWQVDKSAIMEKITDAEFPANAPLAGLALRSGIINSDDIKSYANQLPIRVLLEALSSSLGAKEYLMSLADSLEDGSSLIVFLVHCERIHGDFVEAYIRCETRHRRLRDCLFDLYDSNDAAVRKFSLALLRVLLDASDVAHSDLIINMFTNTEEKQIHLVEPIMKQFVSAIKSDSLIEIDWCLLVFKRLFNHQTTWVRLNGLMSFLDLEGFHGRVFAAGRQEFYCTSLLPALDNMPLYTRAENSSFSNAAPIAVALRRLLGRVQKTVGREEFREFLKTFMQSICNHSGWNSVALLYVSEAVLSLGPLEIFESIKFIQNAINAWTFQEPLLRRVTCRLWLQIAFTFSREHNEGLIHLAESLVEDVQEVREHVLKIDHHLLTGAVGLAALIWSNTETARVSQYIAENCSRGGFWKNVLRMRNVPGIWEQLTDMLRHSEMFNLMVGYAREGGNLRDDREAIVEILTRTADSGEERLSALTSEIREVLLHEAPKSAETRPEWHLVYLWLRLVKTHDGDIISRLFLEINSLDWKSIFADWQAKYVCLCLVEMAERADSNGEGLPIDMLELASILLPIAPRSHTELALRILRSGLAQTDAGNLGRVLKLAWVSCLETRKSTSTFSRCAKTFMDLLFHPTMFDKDFETVREFLEEISLYVESMAWFGEQYYTAMIGLLRRRADFYDRLVGHLSRGLCYGPTFRKDQKCVLDTERYLLTKSCDESLKCLSECQCAVTVRARCISFAKRLPSADRILDLINEVRAYEETVSSTRKRYFNNSNIHRVKTRAWQVVLVLLSVLPAPPAIHSSILENLMNETHQLTVRIFMEWCVVKVFLMQRTDVIEIMKSAISKATDERIGCICSYLNILMHYTCARKDCAVTAQVLPLILPWMMSQHFAVRLHSQFVFKRLALSCRCTSGTCFPQYRPQLEALAQVVTYGCGAKNASKLDRDSYMAELDLTECETYDMVFEKIPRAYGLTDVDCIPTELFDEDDWSRDSGIDVATAFQLDVLDESSSRPDASVTVQESNYQRKVVPVSTLFEEDRHPFVERDQLIVVASLVDQLPNLGGISRTCEIFGVSELTLPNIKMLEMRDFQNLSVSSHQWLPIRGVGPAAVMEYLREKKRAGYTLIGVEQTARSVSLESFKFPKKSLLLLGNEKEGMPLHFIHMMDVCVEIPQQGVVRSLNVHVSAALLVWEYRKQFLAPEQPS